MPSTATSSPDEPAEPGQDPGPAPAGRPGMQGADPGDVAAVVGLVRRARPRCGQVVVVAIDGPSGSGKTTLAGALVQALETTDRPPALIHMDDLYPGWDGLAAATGLLDAQVLAPLARGEDAAYRRWDWHESRWGATLSVPWTPLLVVEGCGCSVRPAGDRAAVRIWVEAPVEVRMTRGIARDGEAYRPHWERWAAQESTLFATDGTRERADLRVDTTPAAPVP